MVERETRHSLGRDGRRVAQFPSLLFSSQLSAQLSGLMQKVRRHYKKQSLKLDIKNLWSTWRTKQITVQSNWYLYQYLRLKVLIKKQDWDCIQVIGFWGLLFIVISCYHSPIRLLGTIYSGKKDKMYLLHVADWSRQERISVTLYL